MMTQAEHSAALLEMGVAMVERYNEAARQLGRERACAAMEHARRVRKFGRKRG